MSLPIDLAIPSFPFHTQPWLRTLMAVCLVYGATLMSMHAESAEASTDLERLCAGVADLKHPLTWVITGDSITHGAKWLGFERSYPELIQEHIRWNLGRRRDFVINTGISGERSAGLLADFEWRALRFHPDVVSIMIGMNDTVAGPDGRGLFEANLRELVRQVRATGAIPILHGTNPIDVDNPSSQSRNDLAAYNEIIALVARSTDTILIDHWQRWQVDRPTLPLLREWLADPIHPNGPGHRAFAREFFTTLGYDYSPALVPHP